MTPLLERATPQALDKLKGSKQGEVVALVEVAPAIESQAKHSALEELPKRQVSAVSLTTINDKQELCNLRDWLEQLRGEVVAGIGRLDEVISNLKLTDSGQRSRVTGRVFQSKSLFKPKRKFWAGKKRWVRKMKGEHSGSGPTGMEKPLVREEESNEYSVSLEGNACLGNFGRYQKEGPIAKMLAGAERRPVEALLVVAEEDGRRLGLSSSVSVGTSGESGRIHGGLEEEVCTSWVKETGEGGLPVVGAEEEVSSENQRGQEMYDEAVGGIRRLEKDISNESGPGRVEGAGSITEATGQGEKAGTDQKGPYGSRDPHTKPQAFTQGLRGEDPHQRRERSSPKNTQTGPTKSFRSGHGLVVVQNREGRSPEVTQGLCLADAQGTREGEDSDQRRGQRSPEMAQTGSTESLRPGHGLEEVQNREGRMPELTCNLRKGLITSLDSPEIGQRGPKASVRVGHGRQVTDKGSGMISAVSLGAGGGSLPPETSQLGDTQGILGAFVNMAEGEKIGVVTPLDEVDTSVILRVTQDLLSGKVDSPAARELKLALEDSGTAGLSCDGQVRKLAGVLG
jgi:hypothetical protein